MVKTVGVVNESRRVTDDEVKKMVAACGLQLMVDVAPAWGAVPKLQFLATWPGFPDVVPAYLRDDADQAGVLGYHSVDVDGAVTGTVGLPFIEVFAGPTLDNGGQVLVGANSVSVTLSHELIEYAVDPGANRWADSPDGTDFALEACDAVESESYKRAGVSVSDFVLPAFFDPMPLKGEKFDFLGLLKDPFSMTPGGYQLHRTEPGQVDQVFACLPSRLPARTKVVEGGYGAQPPILLFGPEFPAWRRPYKVRKAAARALRPVQRVR